MSTTTTTTTSATARAIEPGEMLRPAVIEVLGGLFEGELARVNRHLGDAPRLVLYDEESVVTTFIALTPTLVLEVRDEDATMHLELRRLTPGELVDTVRAEHAGESLIGPNAFGVPLDDGGTVLPPARPRAQRGPPRRRLP